MNFSLIVCTYLRPKPLLDLLMSVQLQTRYPSEILIIDGSTNMDTQTMLAENTFLNLKYFLITEKDRGLTKQRNFGIQQVGNTIEIVCFLDDDTILDSMYFEKILTTYLVEKQTFG